MKHLLLSLLLLTVFSFSVIAQTPQYFNTNTGTSLNAFPFNIAAGKKIQWLIAPGELNQPSPIPMSNITKLYFYMGGNGTNTFTSLTIKLGMTTLTSLPTGVSYTGQMDTVYYRSSVALTSTSSSWMSITLDKPFFYDNTKSLIIDVSQCGCSVSGMNVRQSLLTSTIRRNNINHNGSCAFSYASQDGSIINFGVDVNLSFPNRSVVFSSPGSTSNYIAIPHNPAMVGFQTITIEAWVKLGSSSINNAILNKGAGAYDYQFGVNSSTTGKAYLRTQNTVVYSDFTVPTGVWTHLAVTSNGNTVTFYMNGMTTSSVLSNSIPGTSSGELRIGRGDIDPFVGKIDEVRLWNTERTWTEINLNICNKWVSNSAYGILGKWHLDGNFIDSVFGFNGSAMGSVAFDTAVNCMMTGVKNILTEIPDKFQLYQNFPNPFNPNTTIKFSIPKDSYVELVLYDISGRGVSTLVSDPYKAGTYSVDFNASNLASGVYFYKLLAGNFSMTRKMILVK